MIKFFVFYLKNLKTGRMQNFLNRLLLLDMWPRRLLSYSFIKINYLFKNRTIMHIGINFLVMSMKEISIFFQNIYLYILQNMDL